MFQNFQGNGQPMGGSQYSPFTDLSDINKQRKPNQQGQANIPQAIQSGMPQGGFTPFMGAQQSIGAQVPAGSSVDLGNGVQANYLPTMDRSLAGTLANPNGPVIGTGGSSGQGGVANTPQPTNQTPQSGNNVDRFMSMLNSGKYGSAQDAVNAFNGLGLRGDSTGLSSNYGSSPAVYDNGNTIGLPDRYLTKNADGSWSTTMRGAGGGNGSSPLSQSGLLGAQPTVSAGSPTDYASQLRQQIMQALQVDPRLAAIGAQFGS